VHPCRACGMQWRGGWQSRHAPPSATGDLKTIRSYMFSLLLATATVAAGMQVRGGAGRAKTRHHQPQVDAFHELLDMLVFWVVCLASCNVASVECSRVGASSASMRWKQPHVCHT
jgi:hypothetical protein